MVRRVLIVEDDPEQRLLLQLTLGVHFSLGMARNGQEAIDELDARGAEYDAMVTDVAMPGRNGYDVIAHARSLGATKDLPIVILAARDEHGERAEVADLAGAHFMPKPFDPDELVTTLAALAGDRRSTRA